MGRKIVKENCDGAEQKMCSEFGSNVGFVTCHPPTSHENVASKFLVVQIDPIPGLHTHLVRRHTLQPVRKLSAAATGQRKGDG